MPRRSAADLAVVRPLMAGTRLAPPRDLGPPEREVWDGIVAACAQDHFERSDIPLLRRYCENVILGQTAAERLSTDGALDERGRPTGWLIVAEKCDRALVALSMRLRISPQARMRRETTRPGLPPSPYEMMED